MATVLTSTLSPTPGVIYTSDPGLRAISRRHAEDKTFRDMTPYLWVDYLCIDQANIQERNMQVGMMSQIYSTASLVISWLGPSDKDSEVSVPLIQKLVSILESSNFEREHSKVRFVASSNPLTEEILSIPDAHYESLSRFYARRYFFRCWVLQEMVLAKDLRILCGPDELQLEDLQQVAEFMIHVKKYNLHEPIGQAFVIPMRLNRGVEHTTAVVNLYTYRNQMSIARAESNTLPFRFQQLLILTRASGCFDPRDKVYAMLGMAPRGAFGIDPDYNKSTEELYSEAIRYWIQETQNLDILCWVIDKARRNLPEFPSWIGEFEVATNINQQELAFTNVVHRATGHSKAPPVVPSLVSSDFRVLTVRGKEIDRVTELAEAWSWHGHGVGYDPLWTSMTLKIPAMYLTGQTRGITYEDAALPILHDLNNLAKTDNSGFILSWDEDRQLESVTCSCPSTLEKFTYSSPSHAQSRGTQSRLLCANPSCFYITELQRNRDFKPDTPSAIPHAPSVPDAQDWDSLFSGAMNHKMHLRRVARTVKGYLGLVPDSSQVGGAVWLSQGARVPFVLRRAVGIERTDEDAPRVGEERWEVVGEAYVHGIMEGEVWKENPEEKLIDVHLV
ncbi:uncharacterized protein K460DRAFT_392591 [Cucurbitaria berberidis CBS 394.84]|uniref:Heterokaryon incompatibility domain-containing protein n=1 Tax=Cucurbitaria berberidis CBS 394.84 TaxID=1168544 RepID=A0A9P4LAA6_9PLEO|nr:uncharacterized protein K460DRAFT_392591 [Cucurbitaria berberidis CBS 394.84]KAF1847162.1 hypothetical protein K460DRAFT_392591 [Cucurbitaria berberidis CBS 394.84]